MYQHLYATAVREHRERVARSEHRRHVAELKRQLRVSGATSSRKERTRHQHRHKVVLRHT